MRTCPDTKAIEQYATNPEQCDDSAVEAHIGCCRMCQDRIEIDAGAVRVLPAELVSLNANLVRLASGEAQAKK